MKTLFAKTARLLGALALGAALHTIATLLVATEANASCVTGVASNDALNIRNGPGAKYNIVGAIHPGECGVVTGRRSGNWIWVDHGHGGYVHSRYLRSEDEGGDASDQRCARGVASNDVLNIRQRPTASSAIVGYIPPNGCGVEVRNRSGNWYRVVYGRASGWVNGRYLSR